MMILVLRKIIMHAGTTVVNDRDDDVTAAAAVAVVASSSTSFQTPLRRNNNNSSFSSSLEQQQQQQQQHHDDDKAPPSVPPPPTSWRKRLADRWTNGGAPASSFFVRQRSSFVGGTKTTTTKRSDHLRRLILRQALSRRILSSYTTTEPDGHGLVDHIELQADDGFSDYDDQGIEIVAAMETPTPRRSNHNSSSSISSTGGIVQPQPFNFTIRRVDDDNHHHYDKATTGELNDFSADDVEQMRQTVLTEEATSQRLKYVHSLVQQSSFHIKTIPLEVKLSNVTLPVPSSYGGNGGRGSDNKGSSSFSFSSFSSSSHPYYSYYRRRRHHHHKIKTVYNTSCLYPLIKRLKHSFTGELLQDTWRHQYEPTPAPLSSSLRSNNNQRHHHSHTATSNNTDQTYLLQHINLCLTPGRQYLVLGAPGSGKTSLLKAIAGLVPLPPSSSSSSSPSSLPNSIDPTSSHHNIDITATTTTTTLPTTTTTSTITYNDRVLFTTDNDDGATTIRNAVAYIDSTDCHATRLTVYETLAFAYQCLHGADDGRRHDDDAPNVTAAVQLALATLGLEDVQDRYVGGDAAVRGISGGQRRRVSTGELLMGQTPVLCGDEITTGLDASAAYDMLQVIVHYSRLQQQTKVLALLQPSPEIVSLFDEVIVLCESQIIYAGPIDQVERYFATIGYRCPAFMDIADFLTMVGNYPDHYYGVGTTATTTTAERHCHDNDETMDDHDGTTTTTSAAVTTTTIAATATSVPASPPTASQLAELFRQSPLGRAIVDQLAAPSQYVMTKERERKVAIQRRYSSNCCSVIGSKLASNGRCHRRRYANSFARSTLLIAARFLKLYVRDRRVLIASIVKNLLMGISVGGVFYDTIDPLSIHGALFQAGMFIMLGSMQNSTALLHDRVIYYKHADASFYAAGPFVVGRTLSQLPAILFDTVTFATLLYYMIGLADRASPVNFFIYLSILLTFAILMNAQMNLLAALVVEKSSFQVYAAVTLLLMMLFGGFIIPPNVIPLYYSWLYWINPFAWAYRALIVNEFRSSSGRWGDDPDQILVDYGFAWSHRPIRFTSSSSDTAVAFGNDWIGYGLLYMAVYIAACLVGSALALSYGRHNGDNTGSSSRAATIDPAEKLARLQQQRQQPPLPPTLRTDGSSAVDDDDDSLGMPFTPVTLSFQNLSYVVTSSSTREPLKLLQNVNGILRPGRMCALMGSSGAGKTTLMDVIALRKPRSSGGSGSGDVVTGEVRLNGWPQEAASFRRCSGYVEQFDVQSPELTVRETVLFSSRLRLDPVLVESETQRNGLVDAILDEVELTNLADALVGNSENGSSGGGLSFGERKRLSIAVELAASPSILFLDEPTSGLESRSARLVVKTLRRIADGNRTICATIHQPSASVFSMFDDLLLLQSGGQVVYHGPLGRNGHEVIQYFESYGADAIGRGENAAQWMLRVVTEWNNNKDDTTNHQGYNYDDDQHNCHRRLDDDDDDQVNRDLADLYRESPLYQQLWEEIETSGTTDRRDEKKHIAFASSFATSARQRREQINARLRKIYWRSPTYNLARIMVSLVIAFVLGSVFLLRRDSDTADRLLDEMDMRARLSIIFMGFIITGIMAILSVLPVITKIRDMYYRHRDAGMYDSVSIGLALGVAEKWFIVLSTALFCVVFLVTSGIGGSDGDSMVRLIVFWAFFTFNFAIYSYMGQLFVCLVQSPATAIILCSVFIGINNFFAGLIVRPQYLVGGFYSIPYYICPGHYVYESMVMALYGGTVFPRVEATVGSEFHHYLVNNDPANDCSSSSSSSSANTTVDTAEELLMCSGTASQYVTVFFGDEYRRSHTLPNALILGFILALTRFLTWVALRFVRFGA